MRFLSLFIALLLFPVASHAQNAVCLTQALESVRWNTAERGPLFAVAPDSVQIQQPLPTGRQGASLSVIAPLFSRRIVPVGTITVLAPETMVVLNQHPEQQTPPRTRRREALRPLLTSFNQAQWRQVGSDNGIGLGDMETREQRELFQVLIDSPLPIQSSSSTTGDREPRILSPEQLSGLRFRIQRSLFVQVLVTDAEGQVYAGPDIYRFLRKPPSRSTLFVDMPTESRLALEESGRWTQRTERNRAKPGSLDFVADSLNPAVRLAGIKTVGDAVKRCAAATRLELYVDGRLGRLPLYFRADANTTARSGDLLKGLCWMVTGTFRKVQNGSDSALILTDDLEGYGTRMARITQQRIREWRTPESTSSSGVLAIQKATQKNQAWQQLSDSDDIGFAPTGEIRKALDTQPGGIQVSPSALPEDFVQSIEQAAREHRGLPVNRDQINVRILPRMHYIIPGLPPIGTYESREMSLLYFKSPIISPPPPEPGPVPAILSKRMRTGLVLVAAPKTAEAARTVLRIASEKSIPRVWLQGDVETVQAGVGAGQGLGIAVGAMVPLLRAESTDTTPRDRDIFGKESTWYLSDASETFTKTQRRLRDYAAIPGLAELILTDTAPPGCGIPGGDPLRDDGSEIGYTPARRLVYMRSTGFDPIDLIHAIDLQPLPFMQDRLGWDENTAQDDLEMLQVNRGWGAVRYAANIALMQRLYNDLRDTYPSLPILVHNRGAFRHWYGSWDKPDSLPYFRSSRPASLRPENIQTLFQIAHTQSQRVFLGITYQPGQYATDTRFSPLPDGPQAMARAINLELGVRKDDWDGLVLDLRTVPITSLTELLEGIQL